MRSSPTIYVYLNVIYLFALNLCILKSPQVMFAGFRELHSCFHLHLTDVSVLPSSGLLLIIKLCFPLKVFFNYVRFLLCLPPILFLSCSLADLQSPAAKLFVGEMQRFISCKVKFKVLSFAD